MRLVNMCRARLIRSIGVLVWALAGMVSGMAYGQSIAFESATVSGTEGQTLEISLIRSPDGSGGASGAATALVGPVFSSGAGRADNADITFPANVTLGWMNGELGSKTFSVPLVADGAAEGDETFQFRILDVSSNSGIGTLRNTEVTISDPAPAGPNTLVQFQERSYIGEEGTNVTIVLERVLAAGATMPVGTARAEVRALSGSADSSDVDFNSPTVVNWAAGDTSPKTITISLFDDLVIEGDENLVLRITDVSGDTAIGSPDETDLTIVDINPGQLRYVGEPYVINEEGPNNFVEVQIERVGGTNGSVSVTMFGLDVTAEDGVDYERTSRSGLFWGNGESGIRMVRFEAIADSDTSEGDETFTVEDVDGFRAIGPGVATVTIINAAGDPGEISFGPSMQDVSEGVGSITVVARRSVGSSGEVTADFSIASGGSAQTGVDFGVSEPVSGTFTWGDGEIGDRTAEIDIVDDTLFEPNESFTANLSNLTGGAVIDGSSDFATVNILDNDPALTPGELSFITDYTINEADLTVTLEVTRTGGSDGAVSVGFLAGFNSADDTAFASSDYAVTAPRSGTLNWGDGESTSQFITYDIALDGEPEPTEQFDVLITNAVGGATIGDNVSTVFITDFVAPNPGELVFNPTAYTVD
ncbi:MAG: Calx-beta domain-containing protein, partial [Granulosicoccus sp.]